MKSLAALPDCRTRAETLCREQLEQHYRKTDRWFAGLMGLEWLAGIAAAVLLSRQVGVAVWLGGVIAAVPVCLVLVRPGMALTRHVVAASQMFFSALFIHISGGRVETHFHVFGSLAFLAIYRDWKVLVTAPAVGIGN